MKITLSQAIEDKHPKASPGMKRFQKLWDQAEKLKGSNAVLEHRLQEIVKEVEPIIAEAENEICTKTHSLIDKKLKFLSRKSLAQWQRDELFQWTEESLEFLSYSQHSNQERLQQQIKQMFDFAKPEPAPETPRDTDEAFEDWGEDEELDIDGELELFELEFDNEQEDQRTDFIQRQNEQQDDLFGKQEALLDFDLAQKKAKILALKLFREQLESLAEINGDDQPRDGDEDFDPFSGFDSDQEPERDQHKAALRKLLDGANIKKVFQQLARVLHPDREQDAGLQVEKQGLMAQAIKARDEGDILSLFSLHNSHVQDSELAFDESQIKALSELLNEQIIKLQEAKADIIHASPHHARVYEFFYSHNTKKVAQNIKDYKKMSQSDIQNLQTMVDDLTSLKALRPMLEERYDIRHSHRINQIFNDEF